MRVRELWLGNLPEGVTEEVLYQHFFIYGEIDKIEIFPHKVIDLIFKILALCPLRFY